METNTLILGLFQVFLLMLIGMFTGSLALMVFFKLREPGKTISLKTRRVPHESLEETPVNDDGLDKNQENGVQVNLSEEELLADLNDWERALWDKQCQAYAMLHDGRNPRMNGYMRAQLRRAALRR